jgi:hypothetical protein
MDTWKQNNLLQYNMTQNCLSVTIHDTTLPTVPDTCVNEFYNPKVEPHLTDIIIRGLGNKKVLTFRVILIKPYAAFLVNLEWRFTVRGVTSMRKIQGKRHVNEANWTPIVTIAAPTDLIKLATGSHTLKPRQTSARRGR